MNFNLSALAVRHQSVTLYFLIVSMIAGCYAFFSIERAEDPKFSVKAMVVTVAWPGATAEELDTQVVQRIEKSIQLVGHLYRVESTLQPDYAAVVIEFEDFVRSEQLLNLKREVRRRVEELAKALPAGVMGPYINEDFSDVYFGLIALSNDDATNLMQHLSVTAETMRDELQALDGVEKAVVIGDRPQELTVEFNNDRMMGMGMSPKHLFDTLRAYNLIMPSGDFPTHGPSVRFRLERTLSSAEEVAALPLHFKGQNLRVGDIARVYFQEQTPTRERRRANGRDAVLLGVVMELEADGLELGKRLQDFVLRKQDELPLGFSLNIISNQADAISTTVNLFQKKFIIAVLVVLLVSVAAIGLRAGVIVGIAIPVTLGLTFLLMIAADINLNRVTLGALILSLGLLVDDAIIAIEMMLVKIEDGLAPLQAASYAWHATASPMLFGTLVTIAGFVPIGFAHSSTGEYAGGMFWVLAFSLLVSWLVAVVFTPLMGVKLLSSPHYQHTQTHSEVHANSFYDRLRPTVNYCVNHPWLVLALTVLSLCLAAFAMTTKVEQQFFPSSDRPEVMISIQMPHGTHIDNTDRVVRKLESQLEASENILSYSSHTGVGAPRFFISATPAQADSAYAQIVALAPNAEKRDVVIKQLRDVVAAGGFPEAEVRLYSLRYGPPVTWPVEFRVTGPDRILLRTFANEALNIIASHPNTRDSNLEWNTRTPVYQLQGDQTALSQTSLNPELIATQLQGEMGGTIATEIRQDHKRVAVVIKGDREYQQTGGSLQLRNAHGESLPASQLGVFETKFEDAYYKRYNRNNSLSIRSDVVNAQAKSVSLQLQEALSHLRESLPYGYDIEMGGSIHRSETANKALGKLLPLVLILCTSLVMLQMRTFAGTAMVLSTAPLGLIGAVLALLLTGTPFGFVSLLGMLGLAGILMRNTLILAQQIQDNLAQDMGLNASIVEATIGRARPVLLTAIAAVLAFIPLTLDGFWGPMAVVLIGGVSVGTLITLLFLPAMARICLVSVNTPRPEAS